MKRPRWGLLAGLITIMAFSDAISRAAEPGAPYDVLIRGGTIYDGAGGPPRPADLAIRGDRIAAIGDLAEAQAKLIVNAQGLAVAPGFINMMCWANEALLHDGRGQSEVRQGVTTQVMGESNSMGPVNDEIRKRMLAEQDEIKYPIEWDTLGGYLKHLEKKGVSQNVGSFVGAMTVRSYMLGLANRQPTAEELNKMCALVEQAMREGALGLATALEYSPACYARPAELIALCKAAAKHQGIYVTHIRNEGERLLESLDEALQIARAAKIPLEIYHLKASGRDNWSKMDAAIAKLDEARRSGMAVTADMYCYTMAGTGLSASLPPWVLVDGGDAMRKRLKDPADRARIIDEIKTKTDFTNFYRRVGTPDNIMLVGFRQERLKPLQGKTLGQIARERGKDPLETMLDLLVEDESRIDTLYNVTAEENIRKLVPLPWISFCSDEAAQAPEGLFLTRMPHPRAYGSFARVLGKYVREGKLLPLETAVRKLAALPAATLGLERRGMLRRDYYADVVVFDPQKIQDLATYEKPHQYAVGMRHVFVNGVPVLRDGEHTGATPGRAVWGRGRIREKAATPR